ncbi:MAG: hypothetical protein JJU19_14040 [Pararhodobacter sp.]|nr:hypothetical protein [Pararhodobacter sp.]
MNLSHEGVELLHRHASGWESLGSARFDQSDLDSRLAALRQKAAERSPDGVFSKLVIPAGEMRYATVLAPGPTDEARKLQIEAEIEGMTPYAVDELAYDYVVEGDCALVAMAAREIMAEAEDFAANHGFNPVSFVARPEDGAFQGEPFLGITAAAKRLVPAKDRVVPDAEPVRIVAASAQAAAAPATAAKQHEHAEQDVPMKAAATAGARIRRPAPPAAPERPARPRVQITPTSQPPAPRPDAVPTGGVFGKPEPAEAGGMALVGGLVRRMGNRLRREQAQQTPPADADTPDKQTGGRSDDGQHHSDAAQAEGARPETGMRAAVSAGLARLRPSSPRQQGKDGAPSTKEGRAQRDQGPNAAGASHAKVSAGGSAEKGAAPVPSASASADTSSGAADAPAAPHVAFSSRRRAGPSLAAGNARAPVRKPGPGGRLAILPANGAEKETGTKASASVSTLRSNAGKTLRRIKRAGKGLRKRLSGAMPSAAHPQPVDSTKPTETGAPAAAAGLSARGPAAFASAPEPIVPESRPPADQAAKATEAEALTIFGARGNQKPVRELPRRGLMAAGGVVLLLVAVAIWALYFTAGTPRESELAAVPEATAPAAGTPAIEAPAAIPGPESTPPATTAQEEAPAAAPETEAPIAAAPAEETPPAAEQADPAALLEQLVEDGLRELAPADMLGGIAPGETAPAAPGTEGMTGSAAEVASESQAAPELGEDAISTRATSLAFPAPIDRPAMGETPLAAVVPPPPFGVSFDLGPDGLVEATPEGALTPGGVTVFAGEPAAVPPTRPGGAVAPAVTPEPEPEPAPEAEPTPAPAAEDAALDAETPATAEPETVFDDTPRADPALADARPEPRSARVAEIGATLQQQQQEEGAADTAETATPPAAPPATEAPAAPTEPAQADPGDSGAVVSPGGISLAALRPQRRPTDLVPPAPEAEPAVATVDDADTMPEAVARSLMPSSRPADMSARVAEALAAARRTPAAAAPAATATPAATAPSAGPRIPTSASVAQQATETGLALRRVNLIGVYGTSSDRRALVRLSNGRIVRVAVGDRLDGGQVAAIGDSELRYVRNGRNEVLRIGGRG